MFGAIVAGTPAGGLLLHFAVTPGLAELLSARSPGQRPAGAKANKAPLARPAAASPIRTTKPSALADESCVRTAITLPGASDPDALAGIGRAEAGIDGDGSAPALAASALDDADAIAGCPRASTTPRPPGFIHASWPAFAADPQQTSIGRIAAPAAGAFLVPWTPVPEPATWLTMLAGFGLLGGTLRTDRQRKLRRSVASLPKPNRG